MSIFGSIKDKIAQYIEVYIGLLKVNFIGKTASLMSYFMFSMICLFMVFCTIILLGFGLIELFSSLGLSRVASSFITFGIYLLTLFILVGCRRQITRFFAGAFIKVLTEEQEESESGK